MSKGSERGVVLGNRVSGVGVGVVGVVVVFILLNFNF